MKLLKKSSKAKKLKSYKVSHDLDARLTRIKSEASKKGFEFNINAVIEDHLEAVAKKLEKELHITQDIKEHVNQQDMLNNDEQK